MVTKHDCTIPNSGEAPDFEDADPAVTEPLEALCRQQEVPYFRVRAMADLGRACHLEVGAAAAAIVG